MTASAPERPAWVPESGFWNPQVGRWEVSQHDEQGARQGECLFFRADGSLFSRFRFAGGVQDGPFALYHPDGKLAREGIFAGGLLEGVVTAFASNVPRAEPLRVCCVPPAAVRLEGRYERGQLVQEVFFDGAGQPIRSDGSPWPPRPPGVPDDAEFDESGPRWIRRRPGLERIWTEAGVLAQEIAFDETGARRAVRAFDGGGRIMEACELAPDGRRHGAFQRRFADAAGSPYADPRIRQEGGRFELGQAVGDWTFLDAAGLEVRRAARGRAAPEDVAETSPAFASGPLAAAQPWWSLAGALRAAGGEREALAAAARAAARDGDRAALERFIAAEAVPLQSELAAQRGEGLVQSTEVTPASILDGLVTGADAASAFRALGAVLPGASAAALDFVAAALLLAPDRRMTHLTRALVRYQHGDEAGARADAAIVEPEAPEAAASLRFYLQVSFRPFDFEPAREPLAPDPSVADVPAGVVRDLAEVRAVVARYAARIARVRGAVQARIGPSAAPPWLPPDTAALAPGGFPALERSSVPAAKEEEEENDGTDAAPIEIDEQVVVPGQGVPALLGTAQADWGALGWLCWAVGLDEVALPATIRERELLAVAMKRVVTRCWRVQDRLTTGGLLAKTNGVPGFAWQGVDIDALPQHLARVAAEEYLAARSMFLWLASPEVRSPFQLDLRTG